ncbi:MAG: hypothetical protein JEZ06_04695 [Anaerolineaceae bacterium]|nr:hypothetical protein [Anaerolineaceae bacterium]
MYCTKWCPGCRKARKWLQNNNIDFSEIDIDANSDAAGRVRGWANGNQTTPTFDINGTIVVGYDEQALKRLLIP